MKKTLIAILMALTICVVAQKVSANNDDHHGDHHKQPACSDVAQNHHGHDDEGHNHKEHGHDH